MAHFDVAKPAISNYGMWQYTSKGTVNGVSDRCDCNYAYKDYPAIMKKKCLNLYPSNAKISIPQATKKVIKAMASLH